MANAKPFFISATAVTNCLRGVVFQKQQKTPTQLHPEIKELLDLFRTFADVGQRIQTQLRTFWQQKGVLVKAEEWIPRNEVGFTGKFDAICRINGRTVVYEIKGASKSFFTWVSEHKAPRPEHKMQVMIYHRLLSRELPDLDVRLLYVSRNTFTREGKLKGIEVPIEYSDEEFQTAVDRAAAVRTALDGGPLPDAAPAVDIAWPETKRDVSMKALTCRHHGLCLDDADWYMTAKKELGQEVAPMPEQTPDPEPDVPF